jgi:hypothetical protein
VKSTVHLEQEIGSILEMNVEGSLGVSSCLGDCADCERSDSITFGNVGGRSEQFEASWVIAAGTGTGSSALN